MDQQEYNEIQSKMDIKDFLERVNGLHDSYLIGVEYTHRGHTGGNPHIIDPELTELRLRFMVTSMHDAVVELVFRSVSQWQIKDRGFDVTDCAVSLESGTVIWADDYSTDPSIREGGSYVVAAKMKWRFVS